VQFFEPVLEQGPVNFVKDVVADLDLQLWRDTENARVIHGVVDFAEGQAIPHEPRVGCTSDAGDTKIRRSWHGRSLKPSLWLGLGAVKRG